MNPHVMKFHLLLSEEIYPQLPQVGNTGSTSFSNRLGLAIPVTPQIARSQSDPLALDSHVSPLTYVPHIPTSTYQNGP